MKKLASTLKAFNNQITRKFENWHIVALFLVLYDLAAVVGAYFIALWLRFDCRFSEIPYDYLSAWMMFSPGYAILCILVFWKAHLYQSIWRYASYIELEKITVSTMILGIVHTIGITVLLRRMPVPYYIVGIAIQFLLTVLVRFAYRFVLLERSKRAREVQKALANRVMIIGTGAAGQMILRDLHSAKEINDRVCCIIDDNRNNWGCFIDGVPVVGGRDSILLNVEKYKIQKIFLTLPSATAEQRRDILDICKETNCELKVMPSSYALATGNITANSMQDVALEDLLGRAPIEVNVDEIDSFISDNVIMVTGGGGSIGSELCRQIAKHQPKKLVVFDIYENNAHAIGLELKDDFPELDLDILIGSVRDSNRLNQVFAKYRPDIVYHAAAHKHVPLMEDSPCESIKNNAIGTYNTAYAAMMHGCKRFVLISTDKAVNPTNIMGASKRLCEMIIQTFDRKIREGNAKDISPLSIHAEHACGDIFCAKPAFPEPKTEFVAVRFGNVLGSNGSVVPRFKQQIAKGGPITVTHPDIIRYFMTIPEAASLVLQAGIYADGGEIFVLDMGDPVHIDTLARNLIRLSGLQPDVDIKICYTGLRAGEKLYEEKLMSEEGLRTTPNRLIHIGNPIPFDTDEFLRALQQLISAAYEGQEETIRTLVAQIVPTYHPTDEFGL